VAIEKLLGAASSVAAQPMNNVYGRIRTGSRRAAIKAGCAGLAGLFLIFMLLWFDVALWFYCLPRIGAALASLVAGGALLLVAIALALLPRLLLRNAPPPSHPRLVHRDSLAQTGLNPEALAPAIRELSGVVRENKGMILVAAALLGALLGSRQSRRP